MVFGTRGQVDVGPEGFIARFENDPAIVARIKEIQRRRWLSDRGVWIVEPHWPSARRLLHIASELDWEITVGARELERRLRREGESLEYSVDVVHDNHGKAWFLCKVGDDDRLLAQVKAIAGAEWDDGWWVPTDWEQCCGPLLEVVESDMRLEVSNAAWRLLEEPDVSDQFLRSSAPEPADNAATLSAESDASSVSPEVAGAPAAQSARKARVSTRSKQTAPEPAKRQVS